MVWENLPLFVDLLRTNFPLIISSNGEQDDSCTLSESVENIINIPEYQERLKMFISSILSEKWIFPQKNSHRSLVELYPIEQTENWLSASLLSPYTLKSLLS